MLNLKLKNTFACQNHEKDSFEQLIKQEKLLKDAQSQLCNCHSCGLLIDTKLQQDIFDSLNYTLSNDFLIISFKNNQVSFSNISS